jgi:hypothetical protein
LARRNLLKGGFEFMPVGLRWVSIVFAAVAGVLLLVSGVRGPVSTYELVRKQLPSVLGNSQVLQVVNFVALVFIAIALGAGLSVLAGAFLIYRDHVGTGKVFIGLGAGVGIPWLIMLAVTLVTSGEVATVVAQHTSLGWAGVILAFAARIVAK